MLLSTPSAELTKPLRQQSVILLVDDDTAVRELLRMALTQRGFQVHACADSGHALELAQRLAVPPDLLVTDVDLGGLSGPDMAAQLQSSFPALKILFVSGYPSVIARTVATSTAAATLRQATWLAKPFSMQKLFQQVDQTLAQKS